MLKPGQVKCEVCGTIIEVSMLDWQNKTYPTVCAKCRRKPKRGSYKTLEEAEDEVKEKKPGKKSGSQLFKSEL